MYYYENSSDFRFTCGEIAKWGDAGDIIKITKIDDGDIDYRCELAKRGTDVHADWAQHCRAGGRTQRAYGFD